MKTIYYFLCGSIAVKTFFDDDMEGVKESLNDSNGMLVKFDTETQDPSELAEAVSGWMEVASISEDEYNTLNQ
jgi:hypothetical protein